MITCALSPSAIVLRLTLKLIPVGAASSSVTVAVTVWSANALYLPSDEDGFSVIVAERESPALSMLSFWPCTLTVWAVFQLDVVNVRFSEAV